MFQLKQHLPEQMPILSDSLIDEMHQPTHDGGGGNGYGVGWATVHRNNVTMLAHTGGMAGVQTELRIVPSEHLVVVVLCNAEVWDLPSDISDQIMASLLPKWKQTADTPHAPTANPQPVTSITGVWKGKVATYDRDIPMTLTVTPTGEAHIKLGDQLESLVTHPHFTQGGYLRGILDGSLEIKDGVRRPYVLTFALKLRDAKDAERRNYRPCRQSWRCANKWTLSCCCRTSAARSHSDRRLQIRPVGGSYQAAINIWPSNRSTESRISSMGKISTLRLLLLATIVICASRSRLAFSQTATNLALESGSAKWRLDRDIPDLLKGTEVPSVSIAQIVGGQTTFVAVYGEQEPGVPATPESLYNIASLTKPLTAEVTLRLVSAGRLDLDEPLASYWVDPDLIHDERYKLLTLRLALSHQTGFPNWRGPKGGLNFLRDPGSSYGYSGEGYNYAVRFIQKKTGSNFEDLAFQMLFSPLGMTETAYTGKNWFEHRIAIPTDAKGKLLEPHIPKFPSGADAVYTTARDYARFMIAVMNDEGLSAAMATERDRPQANMMPLKCQGEKAMTCPLYTGYGLGWQILLFPNHTVMMHTGDDDGVRTFAYMDKSTREGAVILTNGENGNSLILPILERLGTPSVILNYVGSQYH